LTPTRDLPGVRIEATVKTTGQTGVEMEALTAVSTAALTSTTCSRPPRKAWNRRHPAVSKGRRQIGRYEAE
jgi:cyclic pyranopterin phosphate synthase